MSHLHECLASSMDAELELLPHLPELFSDLEDLGVRAQDVVGLLGCAPLAAGCRALDLGCGKGAVALAIARQFDLSVRGADAMPDFIAHATERAQREGLAHRCTFDVRDVREEVESARGYDLVSMLALGSVFGDTDETVGVLRQCVRPGGLIIVDEAYLVADAESVEAVGGLRNRDITRQLLQAHGDEIVAELGIDTEENERWCRAATAHILTRARALAVREPALSDVLLEFAKRQRRETHNLCGPVTGALWLLRAGT